MCAPCIIVHLHHLHYLHLCNLVHTVVCREHHLHLGQFKVPEAPNIFAIWPLRDDHRDRPLYLWLGNIGIHPQSFSAVSSILSLCFLCFLWIFAYFSLFLWGINVLLMAIELQISGTAKAFEEKIISYTLVPLDEYSAWQTSFVPPGQIAEREIHKNCKHPYCEGVMKHILMLWTWINSDNEDSVKKDKRTIRRCIMPLRTIDLIFTVFFAADVFMRILVLKIKFFKAWVNYIDLVVAWLNPL